MDGLPSVGHKPSQVFLGRHQKIMIMMTMVIIPPKPKAKRLD